MRFYRGHDHRNRKAPEIEMGPGAFYLEAVNIQLPSNSYFLLLGVAKIFCSEAWMPDIRGTDHHC